MDIYENGQQLSSVASDLALANGQWEAIGPGLGKFNPEQFALASFLAAGKGEPKEVMRKAACVLGSLVADGTVPRDPVEYELLMLLLAFDLPYDTTYNLITQGFAEAGVKPTTRVRQVDEIDQPRRGSVVPAFSTWMATAAFLGVWDHRWEIPVNNFHDTFIKAVRSNYHVEREAAVRRNTQANTVSPSNGNDWLGENKLLGRNADEIPLEGVQWLWAGYIPLGKLTILDGDPGEGKSLLALDLAARLSRGWAMPDQPLIQRRKPVGVILMTAEDNPKDTVVPRLVAAGADLSRIRILELDDGEGGTITLPDDLERITEVVRQKGARFFVIDPLNAFLPTGMDSHKDHDVRRTLGPVAKWAEQNRVTTMAIRHLRKGGGDNPLYLGTGSIGIVGAARAALFLATDPDNPARRIMALNKLTHGPHDAPSQVFEIGETKLPVKIGEKIVLRNIAKLTWRGRSRHTAASLLAARQQKSGPEPVMIKDAVDFLRTVLADGSVAAKAVVREAKAAGISAMTLQRARYLLKIKTRKEGFGPEARWVWRMPK